MTRHTTHPEQTTLIDDDEIGNDARDKLFDEHDYDPPITERERMLEVVDEAETGHQLLARPWDIDNYWQVVHPEEMGPLRIGSPNGGVLFHRDAEDRARLYFDLTATCPKPDERANVPAHVATGGPAAVVAYLYSYRCRGPEGESVAQLAEVTSLDEDTVVNLLGKFDVEVADG